jgi:hypothetical protein
MESLILPQAISFIALGPSFCVAFVSMASHMNNVRTTYHVKDNQTMFHVNNNQTSHINIDQKTFMMKDIQTTSHMNAAQIVFHLSVI